MEKFAVRSLCLSACLMAIGCRHAGKEEGKALHPIEAPALSHSHPGALAYASGFSLERRGDTTVLTVHNPWQGAHLDFAYLLAPGNDSAPGGRNPQSGGAVLIHTPVRKAVTLTTTNLRHLESVGSLDALVGVGGGRYVCSPEIRARIRSGRIRDVGEDVRLDLEAVLALKPDLIFTYVVGNASDGGLAKLAETGVPAVIEGSYMEETPLGRAEWIKFTAAFFGKGKQADSVFAEVDSAYRALADLARTAKHKPTVMAGAPFGGSWWMAGGRTYVARLLADAGGDYLWAADTTKGSLNLDMEAVLGRASGADFWVNAGDWKDLADAKAKDPRNAFFKPWKEGRIYTNDAISCEGGGRDFYETGAMRPDWILADLIAILHPELLPGHKLRWYRRLPGAA